MIKLTALMLMVATAALSQPVLSGVTGEVANGESIVLYGSNFGTKSPAAPILWDNFEDGVAGGDLTASGRWPAYLLAGGFYNDGSTEVNGSGWDVTAHSGSLFAANRITGPSAPNVARNRGGFATNNFYFAATDTIYYSYMRWWDVYNDAADNYGIAKFGRSNAAPNRYYGPGMIGISSMNTASGGGSYGLFYPGGSQVNLEYGGGGRKGLWTRQEIFKINSAPGVANGTIILSDNLNVFSTRTNFVTREAGFSFQQTNIILGLMNANMRNDGDVLMGIDDVYVDKTRARVELGNNAVFASCTVREIQIPSAWSANQITITVNNNVFDPDDTAYLFVINSAGVASPGFAVTVGGELEAVLIGPPGTPAVSEIYD